MGHGTWDMGLLFTGVMLRSKVGELAEYFILLHMLGS